MDRDKSSIVDTAYQDYVFSEKKQLDDVKLYKFKNVSGSGEMKVYNLLEGLQLAYNDLNMETVYQDIKPKSGILKIDYCFEGCYEIKVQNRAYAFLGKGDLSIVDLGAALFENSRIPMKKYRGLTVLIDIELAQKTIDKYFPFLNIDVNKIRRRFCRLNAYSKINSKHQINQIINELYKVDQKNNVPYLIIKVLELLLLLEMVETKDIHKITSFSKPVYDATKQCYKDMLKNPFAKYSITQLAQKYAVSESSLKRCFAYVAGNSIGDFKRHLLLETAAAMLVEKSEMSIKEVADIAGYVNQGKFSAAFKSHFGVTPSRYRQNRS